MHLKAEAVCRIDLYALADPEKVKQELGGLFVKTNAGERTPESLFINAPNGWSEDKIALVHTNIIALSTTLSQHRPNAPWCALLWYATTREA